MSNECLSFDSFMKNNNSSFEHLSKTISDNAGEIYYNYCKMIYRLLLVAKTNKILAPVKAEILKKHNIKHSTSVKMRAVYKCWSDRTDLERQVFYQKFTNNKSKLELLSALSLHKSKNIRKTGRFEKISIDTKKGKIWIHLNRPDLKFEIDDITFIELRKVIFSKTNIVAFPKSFS